MNQAIAQMYDKTFSQELKDMVEEFLIFLDKLTIYEAQLPSWEKIDGDKEPLYEYVKTLVSMDVYKAVPLLIRFLEDLEKSVPFDVSVPERARNEDAFFRVAIQVDIEGIPFTYKRLAGDKTAMIPYYYSPKNEEKGLQFYQTRFQLLKSQTSDIARKMIPIAEYHKNHDVPTEEPSPAPKSTDKRPPNPSK